MFNGLFSKFKQRVQKKMENYVSGYFAAHPDIKLIVVVGSVGKTSTKTSIATMLGQKYRVRMHEGNHNTHMSAPLAILGIPYPDNIKSFSAWRAVFRQAEERILAPRDVDFIIQELGADHPGDIAHFGTYLKPDMAVVTAITPEHMEFFKTMDAVAREEMAAANFSQQALINLDDIESQYGQLLTNQNVSTYGTNPAAHYSFSSQQFSPEVGHTGAFTAREFAGQQVPAVVKVLGIHNLRPAVAAAAVAVKFSFSPQEIANGLSQVRAIPGRMNLLEGARGSMIIDDTYNSSPVAAASAVETFLSLPATKRVAVMGSMNELGEGSQFEHEKIGRMFSPHTVEWVVTVGEEAEKFLAPAAKSNGCQVKSFRNAVEAGAFVRSTLNEEGMLILVKGSQGGVFTEETVKVILRHPEQNNQLVRQSPAWLAHKEDFFAKYLQ